MSYFLLAPEDEQMVKEWNKISCLNLWRHRIHHFDNLENQNLTLKKTPGDIIILHICTINDNRMMYGSWDMEHGSHNFLSFWTVFCPFKNGPRKSKFWKNEKHLKTLSFYKCVPQMTVIWCMVPEIWSATDRISCHFGPFFALLPP